MADDDEIDILGDFSFNSCFAQNDQGIPSCSNREDTVHPQWLLDSTATNWYDKSAKEKHRDSNHLRKALEHNTTNKNKNKRSEWNQTERELLQKELTRPRITSIFKKYGRNISKISQIMKTKTKEEIQTFLDTECGLNFPSLEEPSLEKRGGSNSITGIDHGNVLNMVSTGSPTIVIPKVKKKINYLKSKNSLLKPDILNKKSIVSIHTSEIYYEDDLIVGSTESVGSDLDQTDIVSKSIVKYQAKVKPEKKVGNHRRKTSRNYDKKPRNKSKEILKSPQGRQRKDSSVSDDSMKSPKMQIILGSGQALPVSEGEQVIKIEKKKDSEPESDIDIDVDSDNEGNVKKTQKDVVITKTNTEEAPIAVPLRKFEPMPRRQKKINLDGGGGYTIMHTESGDLYEVGSEPRRERQQRKQQIHLIQCRIYNSEKPAPFEVRLHVSTLIAMDVHAHTSRGEVMGLTGARGALPHALTVCSYRPAAAAAGATHCEMDPVSQAAAAEALRARGGRVCGWHHSHPRFPSAPSARDLATQRSLQRALPAMPFLGFITSQHWPTGRTASQYRCMRVEDEDLETEPPVGYQFSVKLVPDLDADSLQAFLQELRRVVVEESTPTDFSVDVPNDVCPQAGITYLDKCISSVSHHMRSAGYEDSDTIVEHLLIGIRNVFR